jgi:DNA-binding transcriptional LysR family regulator
MFKDLFNRSGLSLDRLRRFLEFADAGSISKAAPDDPNRQSQISRQIAELEEYFKTELTVRRGKTLALSPAGRRLSDLIREQFQDLYDFQLEQRSQSKTFSIGAGASILEWLVIPTIADIRQLLGNVTLQLSSRRSGELIEDVCDGKLDFAVVREDAIPKGLPSEPLVVVKFVLCASRKLLGNKPASSLDDPSLWKKLPFAANAGGGQLDRTFRQAMVDACGSFQPVIECDSLLQIRELVVQGTCAGLLAHIGTNGLAEKGVVLREFAPLKNYGRALALHWNKRQIRRRGEEEDTVKNKLRKVLSGQWKR